MAAGERSRGAYEQLIPFSVLVGNSIRNVHAAKNGLVVLARAAEPVPD